MPPTPIPLEAGEAIRILIDGHVVSVAHMVDGDGGHAVTLEGIGCFLDGEMPGV